MRARVLCAALALGLAACYSVPRSELARQYRTIYVPTFANETFEPGLHTRVTRAIRREILHDGQLRLVNTEPEADLVLTGTLTSFGVRATSYDDDDNPLQFRVAVVGTVEARESRTGTVVWRREALSADDYYQVRSVTAGRGRDEGLNEAAEEFAERVVLELVDSAW